MYIGNGNIEVGQIIEPIYDDIYGISENKESELGEINITGGVVDSETNDNTNIFMNNLLLDDSKILNFTSYEKGVSFAFGYAHFYDTSDLSGDIIDVMKTESSNNITTGDGSDYVVGTDAANIIFGNGGADNLRGGFGDDIIYGGDGSDYLQGENNKDTIYGGDGSDNVYGGNGSDTLYGDAGNDWILGDNGKDTIYGGDGNDVINGGKGKDTIEGGNGADILTGGEGNDVFYYGNYYDSISSAHDTITDFSQKFDVLQFENSVLGNDWTNFIVDFVSGNTVITHAIASDFELHLNGEYTLSSTDFDFV